MTACHDAFLRQLRAACAAPDAVITDAKTLTADYSIDRSYQPAVTPRAAVRPATPEEVQKVVRTCVAHRVPMTPRGAGTGLEGAAVPAAGSIVIDTERLNRLDVHVENMSCWVGAGVKKMSLNKYLGRHGFVFGPDPSSNPCVGGMASTSGSGMSTLRYGTTRENIVSLRVVTAQGELIQTKRAVRKSSTGLDLTQLYCGSEGTLGVICELCVKIQSVPKHRSGGIVTFSDAAAAVRTAVILRRKDLHALVRCEMLNREGVTVSNKHFNMQLKECPTILIELQADSVADLEGTWKTIAGVAQGKEGATDAKYYSDGAALDEVWEARRGCLPAALKYRGNKNERVLNTDVCVPLPALAQCVADTEKDFAAAKVPCVICAHIADGNFHNIIPFNNPAEQKVVFELEGRLVERALAAGGTVSGEHGVGLGKLRHLLKEHGASHLEVQRRVKQALDPHDLMNPGKLYPTAQL